MGGQKLVFTPDHLSINLKICSKEVRRGGLRCVYFFAGGGGGSIAEGDQRGWCSCLGKVPIFQLVVLSL